MIPGRIRSGLKRLAERTLVHTGVAKAVRNLRRDRVAILAYHNIVPKGERRIGDRSLHLPQEDFARQLDILCETHRVVELDALLDPGMDDDVPRAVITFDDAYVGAMTAGLEELSKRGLTCTVFVSPGCLGIDGFWWDQLADPDTGILGERLRSHALSALHGDQSRVMAWARDEGLRPTVLPDHARPTSIGLIRRVLALPTTAVESHTWSHLNLTSCSPSEVITQVYRSQHWIKNTLGGSGSWLAYPYGLYSKDVIDPTSTMHVGALRIDGGLSRPPFQNSRRWRVPRINVPSGISAERFMLVCAGLG